MRRAQDITNDRTRWGFGYQTIRRDSRVGLDTDLRIAPHIQTILTPYKADKYEQMNESNRGM